MADFDKDINPIIRENSMPTEEVYLKASEPVAPMTFGDPVKPGVAPEEAYAELNRLSAEANFNEKGVFIKNSVLDANKRYETYNPTIENQEDFAGYGQSSFNKAKNGVLKGLNLAATTVAGSFAMLGGLAISPFTGRLADIWDNEALRKLDAWNNKVDNEFLPNYYTEKESSAKWYAKDNWFTANFLFDKVIKNAGFSVGAMVAGNIANAGLLRAGMAMGKGAAALAASAESSQAFKIFTPLLRNTSRAFSYAKNVEAAQILEKQINSIADIAEKSSQLAKISTDVAKYASFGDKARRTAIAAYSSAGESAFEGLQTSKEFRENLVQQYKDTHGGQSPLGLDLENINLLAEKVGKTSFFGNMGLLSVTEWVQLPYLVGSTYRNSRHTANSILGEAGEVVLKDGKYVSIAKTPTKFGKIAKGVARATSLTFDPKEGAQEIGQYALQIGSQNYFNKARQGKDASIWVDGFLYGMTGTDERGHGVGALTSKAGLEGGLIGAFTGGMMQIGQKYKEGRRLKTNTQDFIKLLDNAPSAKQAFQDKLDGANRGIILQEQEQDAIIAGDELEAKDLKTDQLHNYLSPRIKYGRLDMVLGDLDEMRKAGATKDGLAELKASGVANVNDTVEEYQARLNKIETTAKSTAELYNSMNLTYSGEVIRDPKTKQPILDKSGRFIRRYTSEVIDKMVYAAAKIVDYDNRIPQVSSFLNANGIETAQNIVNEELTNENSTALAEALTKIDIDKPINGDQIKQNLKDVVELASRRKYFLDEYNDMKKNPYKYITTKKIEEESEEDVDLDETETIEIKTTKGKRTIQVGTEYFRGKSVSYDKNGNAVYSFPKFTVLGIENGKIKIKEEDESIELVSPEYFEEFSVGSVKSTLGNKTAKYFMEHINVQYEYHFGPKNGGTKPGYLQFKNNKLYFEYINSKGQLRWKELTNYDFQVQKDYNQARIVRKGELKAETESQKTARENMLAKKEEKEHKAFLAENRTERLRVLGELQEESKKRLEEVNKELEKWEGQLTMAKEDLEKMKVLKEGEKIKGNLQKTLSNTTKNINKVSKLLQEAELQVKTLVGEKDDIALDISYFEDYVSNIDQFEDSTTKNLVEELRDQVEWVKDMSIQLDKTLAETITVGQKAKEALQAIVKFLRNVLHVTTPSEEWKQFSLNMDIDSQIDNILKGDNILTELATLKENLGDYVLLEDMAREIPLNEQLLKDAIDKINETTTSLKNLRSEQRTKEALIDKLQVVVDEIQRQEDEVSEMLAQEEAMQKHLNMNDSGIPTEPFIDIYEPEKKKDQFIIGFATTTTGDKPHAQRSNRFGINLSKFKNKIKIRGAYITAKTESQLIPGLTQFLEDNADEPIVKKTIIAMVMVQIDEKTGKKTLVDVNGKAIAKKKATETVEQYNDRVLNTAIFQTLPLEELKQSAKYGGKTMFRESTPEFVREAIRKSYKVLRDRILEGKIIEYHKISASFGIPVYPTYKNEKGEDENIYTSRTSVEDADLITDIDLESQARIHIPKTKESAHLGTTTFMDALGKLFLNVGNAYTKLKNRQHSKKEAENIFNAILSLSRNIIKGDVTSDHSTNLFDYLKSVVYWGIPKTQTGVRKDGAFNNSVYWESDSETGKFMLTVGKKVRAYIFTPTELNNNREAIINDLYGMYMNVNSAMANDVNSKYKEVLNVAPDGTITYRQKLWNNYQTYLLAKVNPDGEIRSGEEIPLVTNIKALDNEKDVNREGVYFYTTDNPDDIEIPTAKAPVKSIIGGNAKQTVQRQTKTIVKEEEEEDEEATEGPNLDGETPNIYITPRDKQEIKYVASESLTEDTIDTELLISLKTSLTATIEYLKSQNKPSDKKSAERFIKEQIFNSIKKYLPSAEEDTSTKEWDDHELTVPSKAQRAKDEAAHEKPSVEKPSATAAKDAFANKSEIIREQIRASMTKAKNTPTSSGKKRLVKNKLRGYKKEDWTQLEKWLKKTFPHIPVYRVKNIIEATNGRQAWGMFQDGALYIYENAEVGTVYHEVFHAIWEMATTPKERAAIQNEFNKRTGKFYDPKSKTDIDYSKADIKQIEERLAEELRNYIHYGEKPIRPVSGGSAITKFFNDLIEIIKAFFLRKGARSNVEALFKNIKSGQYKNFIPYSTNLSLAKAGIQDIEQVIAREDSEFSLVGITDRERSEIIQHMTYATLKELIDTDKSLMTLSTDINRDAHYEWLLNEKILPMLGTEIIDVMDMIEEDAAVIDTIDNIAAQRINLMSDVITQWDAIVARHEEYLRGYNVEFDENDHLQITDEDSTKESDRIESTKIDHFRKANPAIKLLISTIPIVDKNGEKILSSVGGVKLLPVSQVYASLMNNLHTSATFDEMMVRLAAMAVEDANYRELFTRLTKQDWKTFADSYAVNLEKIDTTYGAQLIGAFWQSFKKQNPTVKNVFIYRNGDVIVADASLSTAADQLRNQYQTSIIRLAKQGKGFFKYSAREKAYIGDINTLMGVDTDNLRGQIEFLAEMGIIFDINDLSKLDPESGHMKVFEQAVDGIRESIIKSEKIVSFTGKALNINKRLLQLGLVQAAITNPEFNSTFFNVSGERTQSFIGNNPAERLHNFLSGLDSYTREEVANSDYRYLWTDVFAQGSNLIERMFASDGTRKANTEDLGKVGYVSGTSNEKNGKDKPSSKLSQKERIIQELNLNIGGWYLNLVPGDASMEWMVKLGNAIKASSLSKGMDEVNEIFRKYFIAELNLVREKNRPVAKDRDPNEMRFFKAILGKELHAEIIDAKGKSDAIYAKYGAKINRQLDIYMTTQTQKYEKMLIRYGVLKDDFFNYNFENVALPQNMSESEKDRQLKALTINFIINNIELHKLLYADPYQYADELKRIKNFNSPRQELLASSNEMDGVLQRVWNGGFKKGDLGYTSFTRGYFRTVTHEDVTATLDLQGYTTWKETDGGGIINFIAYRHFRIRAANWNDNEEKQFRYDIAWEKRHRAEQLAKTLDKDIVRKELKKRGLILSEAELQILSKGNPEVKSAYTPIKPIVSGNRLNEKGLPNNINDVVMDKFALYPLSFRAMYEFNSEANILKLHDKMMTEDIDYMVFENSRKVGARVLHSTYDVNTGKFNTTPYDKAAIINVPFNIMSVQTDVPSKDDGEVTRGSQVTKLITMDLMEAGVPVDFGTGSFAERYKAWYEIKDEKMKEYASPIYAEIKRNEELLVALTEAGYQNLLIRLGVKQDTKGDFSIKDFFKAVETLKDEVLKREINDNISDALTAFAQGKSTLEATPAYQQIRNILYSIVDKEVISQKMPGGMKVLLPVTLFESVKVAPTEVIDSKGRKKYVYTSDTLNFYSNNVNGKTINVCEIFMGRWFDSPLSDEELITYLNETEEGQKILSGFGFRIPTQKQNSIEVFKIKKFLPREFGDSVILPSAMVAKTGGDFDIDKLTMYLKNITETFDGKPRLIPYLDKNSSPEERYYRWVMSNIDHEAKVKVLTGEEVTALKAKFKERFDAIQSIYGVGRQTMADTEYESLVQSYRTIKTKVRDEQDRAMIELFNEGSLVFRKLRQEIKDEFFQVRDELHRLKINGPEEIRQYRALVERIDDEKSEDLTQEDKDVLQALYDLYGEELLVLGSTEDAIKLYDKTALQEFHDNKSKGIVNLGKIISLRYTQVGEEQTVAVKTLHFEQAKQLAESNDLVSYEEFLKKPISQQNTKKALQNEFIQSSQNIVSSKENYDRLIQPNSSEQLSNLGRKIAEKTLGGTFDYSEVGNMLDREFMTRLRHAFVTGKYAIGIAAVNNINHSLNQRQLITVLSRKANPEKYKQLSKDDQFFLGDGEVKFEAFNSIDVNGVKVATLSMIRNAERNDLYPDGQDISQIITQFIDGYVDISKGPWIMELGATPNVSSTFLFLTKIGVPIDTIAYFMNQPIVRDYLDKIDNAGYSWLFIEDYVDELIKSDKYFVKDSSILVKEMTQIPTKADLEANVGKEKFESNQEKIEQQFILKEFLKYAKMAEHMFLVTQGMNFDTANFNDPYLIFKKIEQLKKAQNSIISSVDELIKNSFVKDIIKRLIDSREAMSQFLKSDQPTVRKVIEKVLLPYINVRDKEFTKLAQKATNDLFDWAVQTNPRNGQGQLLSSLIRDVLVKDGGYGNRIMKFVTDVKNNPSHALYDNHIIKIFDYKPSEKVSDDVVNNVQLLNTDNKVYDQNNIIYAFRELRNDPDVIATGIYKDFVTLAIMQSGLSNSPISFTSLLPYEDFEVEYNEILAKLETIPNLDLFYKLGVFERRNYSNDDVVPHTYAKWITYEDKSGAIVSKYNPAMAFLHEDVRKAVESGKIPPIISQMKFGREDSSEYIVYSWEKQHDLLSEEELQSLSVDDVKKRIEEVKSKMRKNGDLSYINRGLFKKIYFEGTSTPMMTIDHKGRQYNVYKAINSWGDSYKANEFYDVAQQSVIDNGFIKVDEVSDNTVINHFPNVAMARSTEIRPTPEFNKLPGKSNRPTLAYAGIGSRETPGYMLTEMRELAKELEVRGYTLRSGKAGGADQAFEAGVSDASKKQIFPGNVTVGKREHAIAREIHPNPAALDSMENSNFIWNLMARNTNQVFGKDLNSPVDFVVAWTKDGWIGEGERPFSGGTNQAIDMAYRKGIPVINLASENWREDLDKLLSERYAKKGGSIMLNDKQWHPLSEINTPMLEEMGYTPTDIFKILKSMC